MHIEVFDSAVTINFGGKREAISIIKVHIRNNLAEFKTLSGR